MQKRDFGYLLYYLFLFFFVSSFVWAEGDLGTYKFLGEIYQRQERYEKAINLYQEAIKKFPEEASKFQYLIGESSREAKDFFQALNAFRKLIKSYPESEEAPRAQLAIARIYGMKTAIFRMSCILGQDSLASKIRDG